MKNEKGFTLIEMAIVTLIMGIMIAAMANMYNLYIQEKRITQTQDSVDTAYEALDKYVAANGFLPCPADPADSSGVATDCTKSASGGVKEVTISGAKVRIGAFPVMDNDRDTRLVAASKAVDGWKNKLTYAVVVNKAKDAKTYSNSSGVIKILDSSKKTLTSKAEAVVISHGANKGGAYNIGGKYMGKCSSGNTYGDIDKENCDDDAVFIETADRGYTDDDIMEYFMAGTEDDGGLGELSGQVFFDLTAHSGSTYDGRTSSVFADITDLSEKNKKKILKKYEDAGAKKCTGSWGMTCLSIYEADVLQGQGMLAGRVATNKFQLGSENPPMVVSCAKGKATTLFDSYAFKNSSTGIRDGIESNGQQTSTTYARTGAIGCIED